MNLKAHINRGIRKIKKNSPTILFGVGLGSLIGAVPLAVVGTKLAIDDISEMKKETPEPTKKDIVACVWKDYIPTGLAVATGTACMIASDRMKNKSIASLAATCEFLRGDLKEYAKATKEIVGEEKEKEIRERKAENKAAKTDERYSGTKPMVLPGHGNVLVWDELRGLYFYSNSKNEIEHAFNLANNKMLNEDSISLNDICDLLCVPSSSVGEHIEFRSINGLIEVGYGSHISPWGELALVIEYDSGGGYDFRD